MSARVAMLAHYARILMAEAAPPIDAQVWLASLADVNTQPAGEPMSTMSAQEKQLEEIVIEWLKHHYAPAEGENCADSIADNAPELARRFFLALQAYTEARLERAVLVFIGPLPESDKAQVTN